MQNYVGRIQTDQLQNIPRGAKRGKPYLCGMQNGLDRIQTPADLRKHSEAELPAFAAALRHEIIQVVSQREGHLGASLGVVELTLALHYVFDTPEDVLIWDVGHQAYGHKMLTGRRKEFNRLRERGGLSGFPKRDESPYDPFGTGHSSTSLSAATGMALASQQQGNEDRVHIAVIGDASIASGMAFEALNHLGTTTANVMIVLNDNAMGIDPSVGALKDFFARGKTTSLRNPNLFDPLNIPYSGPLDGHDLAVLIPELQALKKRKGPRILHLRTLKGKGLDEAEKNQILFHAPGKFDPLTGKLNRKSKAGYAKFQQVVGETLEALFADNPNLMCITPAMPTGSGIKSLMERYPARCIDVGIAEQHAVTLAAGMATQGVLPICILYSTFLQRAYDQVIHDVALQNLKVLFLIDRAGVVGQDGPTHHGLFDIAFLRTLPNTTLLAPKDEAALRQTLFTLQQGLQGPTFVRYPRGYGALSDWKTPFEALDVYKGECLKEGKDMALLSVGTCANAGEKAIAQCTDPARVGHYSLGPIKPLDTAQLKAIAKAYKALLVVEEGMLAGGVGQEIVHWASQQAPHLQVSCMGVDDAFVPHGATEDLYAELGLDADGIAEKINRVLDGIG